ncbi:hypothetical protein HHK36_028795 [Tetracentron sinense]|uniref:BHLH domain-containing protein n=1 Tax=Tetracentron sinense TaxID=13715 RepID=A0A835D2Y6_TETSI|nr:hypothetical protein HHK36_028795 [Tetracentron sinense]
MFSLHQSNELFQIFSNPSQQHTIPQDMIPVAPLEGTDLNTKLDKSRRRKSSASPDDNDESDNHEKKITHRDLERKRRKEMATLFGTLRSLVPLEYHKGYDDGRSQGKQSTSDQMNEAVKYIRDQQKKIQELGDKRDGLKRLPNLSALDSTREKSQNCLPDSVTVQPCWAGVEAGDPTSIDFSGLQQKLMDLISS